MFRVESRARQIWQKGGVLPARGRRREAPLKRADIAKNLSAGTSARCADAPPLRVLHFCLANTANALADSAGRLGAKTNLHHRAFRVKFTRDNQSDGAVLPRARLRWHEAKSACKGEGCFQIRRGTITGLSNRNVCNSPRAAGTLIVEVASRRGKVAKRTSALHFHAADGTIADRPRPVRTSK